MHQLQSFLGSKITARRSQIVIIKMPDQTWPGVIEHPLNDAGSLIFISAVRLEHGALSFISHGLRLPGKVGKIFGLAVASLQSGCENVYVLKFSAARVEFPDLVNGPQLVF